MEALGKDGDGVCGGAWWHPTYPYHSSLTGETCQQLADDFEKTTGNQWTQPIMHYVSFEWVVDVLKRTTNVDDKEEIMKRVTETKMADSVAGPIDFTVPVGPDGKHKVPNVYSTPLYGSRVAAIERRQVDVRFGRGEQLGRPGRQGPGYAEAYGVLGLRVQCGRRRPPVGVASAPN